MRQGAAAAVLLLALSCSSKERTEALARISGRTARERVAAVKALAQAAGRSDDEAWDALAKATRDGAAPVRKEAANALARAPAGSSAADDALGGLLRDPDDEVRIEAARGLGARCGERGLAWLRVGFSRSGSAVRREIADALARCGVPFAATLRHDEERRRARALEQLDAQSGAQRAKGLDELGRLGRPQDAKALLPLLDDRDGTVAAAAARAAGEARAVQSAPKLCALIAEEGLVAGSAAEGLAALGADAVRACSGALSKAALREGDDAAAAALALRSAGVASCALAAEARDRGAARVAAQGCPAAPLLRALEQPDARIEPLLAALAVAQAPAEGAGRALGKLIAGADRALAAQAASLAARFQAREAGAALLATIDRERKLLEARRSEARKPRPPASEDTEAAAQEAALSAARAPPADRARYDALMVKLRAHDASFASHDEARARLAALLRGGAHDDDALLFAALSAALALKVPGSDARAAALSGDTDPRLAALASRTQGGAAFSQAVESAAAPARSPCDPPAAACLEELAHAPPEVARTVARLALFSDDGKERAAACSVLGRLRDAETAGVRRALSDEAERRVRDSCAASMETARQGTR